jgi:RNA-binding protein
MAGVEETSGSIGCWRQPAIRGSAKKLARSNHRDIDLASWLLTTSMGAGSYRNGLSEGNGVSGEIVLFIMDSRRFVGRVGDSEAGMSGTLRGKDRRYLRGLGVALKPAVVVGKEGMSASVLAEIDRVIGKQELIKVRLLDTVDGDRKELARDLAGKADVELIQVLGRTVLLYRRNEEEPGIELPG